jgi:hypothetical protein
MMDNRMPGIGGAPTRATTFPPDAAGRKERPVASGVLDYFPDALVAVSEVSFKANQQHNPDQPLHWARSKSTDEADALMRHVLQRGLKDDDGLRHSAKLAWRALALLQKEVEAEQVSVRDFGMVTQTLSDLQFETMTRQINPPIVVENEQTPDSVLQNIDGGWFYIGPGEYEFWDTFETSLLKRMRRSHAQPKKHRRHRGR